MDIDPLPSLPDPVACLLSIAVNMPDFGAGQIVALLCALVALLLSGFFSGSEISYFSLDSNQIEEIEEEGKRGEKIVKLLRQPERLLATILISNNLVNVTIVVLCNYALGPVFEGLGEVMSFILQTVLLTLPHSAFRRDTAQADSQCAHCAVGSSCCRATEVFYLGVLPAVIYACEEHGFCQQGCDQAGREYHCR